MILKSGQDWLPTYKDIDFWTDCYPNINIEEELRKMEAWLYSNPAKRKTKSGMPRFVNSWLSRTTPKPVDNSTRSRSLEQDLTDTSWAYQ